MKLSQFKNLFRNKKIIFFGLIILLSTFYFLFSNLTSVFAQIKFTPQIPIPGMQPVSEVGEWTLADYISSFYQWAVIAIAIITVFVIIFQGINWILAGGSPPAIQKAREHITSAIIGLILVLLTVPILKIINPQLVARKAFKVPRIVAIAEACKDLPETDWKNFEDLNPGIEKEDLECGKQYEYPSEVKGKYNICYGHLCFDVKGTICFPIDKLNEAKCVKPEAACFYTDKNYCELTDESITGAGIQDKSCRKWEGVFAGGCQDALRTVWGSDYNVFLKTIASIYAYLVDQTDLLSGKDCCIYGPLRPYDNEQGIGGCDYLGNAQDWKRVNCEEGQGVCSDVNGRPKACSAETGGRQAFCTNNPRANAADGICCKNTNTNEYRCAK